MRILAQNGESENAAVEPFRSVEITGCGEGNQPAGRRHEGDGPAVAVSPQAVWWVGRRSTATDAAEFCANLVGQ
jgi:hypothetical protein